MENVSLLRVVVASPSDVPEEREAVARVADELNRSIGRAYNLRVEINRWETDAYPGFHVNGPQALIDPTLSIEECDVFVGIFWKRFGTAINGGVSGTEHEFQKAYESWKAQGTPHIMFYFNQCEHTPNSSDEQIQWERVREFQRSFPSEGLWWTYGEVFAFERLIRQHLTMFILGKLKEGSGVTDDDGEQDQDDGEIYAENFVLDPHTHVPFSCDLKEDDQINIDLNANGAVDVMIFDEGDYKTWLRDGVVDEYFGWYQDRPQLHAFFKAREDGEYFVVISNSYGSVADIDLTISYVYD